MKKLIIDFIKEEDAMGVVEVVLIIMVLVTLAFLFKEQITAIAKSLFESLKGEVEKF